MSTQVVQLPFYSRCHKYVPFDTVFKSPLPPLRIDRGHGLHPFGNMGYTYTYVGRATVPAGAGVLVLFHPHKTGRHGGRPYFVHQQAVLQRLVG